MPKNNPVLIFDLDETILSVNSFPYWVRYMLFGWFGGLSMGKRMVLSRETAKVMMERKFQGGSHLTAKRKLQKLWQQAVVHDNRMRALARFNSGLYKKVRPQMKEVLQAVRDGRVDALLATAAVSEYADHLAYLLGFQHVITTPQASPRQLVENARERKRDNVIAFLEAQGWSDRPRIFFTDHMEDLPLIQKSQLVLWFGKSSDMKKLGYEVPEIKLVNCQPLSSSKLMELVQNA